NRVNSATGPLPLHFLCLSLARALWIGTTELSQERVGSVQHAHAPAGRDLWRPTRRIWLRNWCWGANGLCAHPTAHVAACPGGWILHFLGNAGALVALGKS